MCTLWQSEPRYATNVLAHRCLNDFLYPNMTERITNIHALWCKTRVGTLQDNVNMEFPAINSMMEKASQSRNQGLHCVLNCPCYLSFYPKFYCPLELNNNDSFCSYGRSLQFYFCLWMWVCVSQKGVVNMFEKYEIYSFVHHHNNSGGVEWSCHAVHFGCQLIDHLINQLLG